jgi:hypothetical protein
MFARSLTCRSWFVRLKINIRCFSFPVPIVPWKIQWKADVRRFALSSSACSFVSYRLAHLYSSENKRIFLFFVASCFLLHFFLTARRGCSCSCLFLTREKERRTSMFETIMSMEKNDKLVPNINVCLPIPFFYLSLSLSLVVSFERARTRASSDRVCRCKHRSQSSEYQM